MNAKPTDDTEDGGAQVIPLRAEPTLTAEQARGLAFDAVQDFVCRFCGDFEFFERPSPAHGYAELEVVIRIPVASSGGETP